MPINIERALRNGRLMRALTGLAPQEFTGLLPLFAETWERTRANQYLRNPKRQRKPGGGSKGFLKTPAEKLFFILLYYRCYPTYDVLGFFYDANRSNAFRRQEALTPVLERTLGRKLVLPKRQIRSVKEFFEAFPEAKEVFIDGTERPIQRPKDAKRQRRAYSGKKKRHTQKNLIMSDRYRRIGFLGKTVPGSLHDFTVFKAQAPPEALPQRVLKHLDLGFQGFAAQYPGHRIAMPERKPRTRELSAAAKERNKKKSSLRVLAEHAIGGAKRFRIVSDVFRNRKKGFGDTAMLIACGLWNYHLAAR